MGGSPASGTTPAEGFYIIDKIRRSHNMKK
jgi:hypothetical protein